MIFKGIPDGDGTWNITTYHIEKWSEFNDFLMSKMIDYGTYIYRGQSDSRWELKPSLSRIRAFIDSSDFLNTSRRHTNRFKNAIKGRYPGYERLKDASQEATAVGQHFGMKTRFLDFTHSPFVAAFFAFAEPSQGDYVSVCAVARSVIKTSIDEISIYTPQDGDCPRIVAQDSLFLSFKTHKSIEELIHENFELDKKDKLLIKIVMPSSEREIALRMLRRMNISHKTLFPDMIGAALYSNMCLEIEGY